MIERIIQIAQKMKPWQIVVGSVLVSEILTELIVPVMHSLLRGVANDFMITGAVTALIVSFLIATIVVSGVNRLRDDEALHRKLFEAESNAVVILDAGTLRYEDCNPAALTLYGYTKEELLSLTPKDLSCEVEKTEAAIKATSEGELKHVPLRYQKKKDGTVVPVEIYSGAFLHQGRKKVLGVIIDLTEKMKLLEAVRECEERYRLIFQQATDYVLVLEFSPDGPPVIVDASNSAFEMHGYSRNELLGKPINFLETEESKSKVPDRMRLLMADKRAHFEVERLDRDGGKFYVEVNAAIITVNGKPVIYSIERDITDWKKTEERRLELLKQIVDAMAETNVERGNAQEANRLKSEFLANMTHELNTPLASVIGFSRQANSLDSEVAATMTRIIEILEKSGDSQPWVAEIKSLAGAARKAVLETSKFDNIVMEKGQALFNLLNDLMELSKLESGRIAVAKNTLSTYLLLAGVEGACRGAAKAKGLALSVNKADFRPADILFQGDRAKLEKVLNHLVQNAIKYSDKGDVRVTASVEGENIVFRVKDEGRGIPDREKEKIFETFRQLDGSATRHQGGLGLGLAFAKKLVQAMGGDIGLQSEVGKGSEFIVTLPCRPVSAINTEEAN